MDGICGIVEGPGRHLHVVLGNSLIYMILDYCLHSVYVLVAFGLLPLSSISRPRSATVIPRFSLRSELDQIDKFQDTNS